jgi:hypothetical protein
MCVALHQYVSHARLVVLLFLNLSHNIETGTAKAGKLLIATHDLDQSNNLANQQQVLDLAVPYADLSIM